MFIDKFSQFFMSAPGKITACVAVTLLICLFAFNLRKGSKLSVKAIAYAAICIALAMILSNVKLYEMPYGGTLTACSMIFVSIIGYWFGLTAGITAAVAYGLLQLITDPYVIHPVQLLLDYPLAFGMLGLSGLFSEKKYGLYTGYILGAAGRILCSTLSGVIFFYESAGSQNVYVYSFLYNISYILPEVAITMAIISVGALKSAILRIKASVAA